MDMAYRYRRPARQEAPEKLYHPKAEGLMLHCDITLSRRLERAEGTAGARFVEARARAAPESGATWVEVAGAYAMYDGPLSPVTQTFGLGVFQTPQAEDFERTEAFFSYRGTPVFHVVSPI